MYNHHSTQYNAITLHVLIMTALSWGTTRSHLVLDFSIISRSKEGRNWSQIVKLGCGKILAGTHPIASFSYSITRSKKWVVKLIINGWVGVWKVLYLITDVVISTRLTWYSVLWCVLHVHVHVNVFTQSDRIIDMSKVLWQRKITW